MKKWFLLFGLLLPALSQAQNYSISWYKVAGGGTSRGINGGSVYAVSGTIGQPNAGGALTGGGYPVTGDFGSILSVAQTAEPTTES